MINMSNRKGITPIISIIILLGITVALAGLAWTVLSNYIGGYTEKTFEIPFDGGVYCIEDTVPNNWTIRVFVRNTGTQPLVESDFTIVEIDGTTVPTTLSETAGIAISSGGSGFLINTNNGGTGWSVDKHTIVIATESGTIKNEVVFCG